MRRGAYLFIILISVLLFSCDLELLTDKENVNDYIYPYLEFTPDEDGEGYTVTVVDGAELEEIYIPSSVEVDGESVPVTTFEGFQNPEDAKNVKTITLESPETKVSEKATEGTGELVNIKVKNTDPDAVWGPLPVVEKEGKEFIGWFIKGTSTQVFEGDLITDNTIEPRFREHTLVKHEAKAPTCADFGWNEYMTCSTCSYSTFSEIAPLGHNLHMHDKCDATCTTEGYTETNWECKRCGRYYNDSEGKTEIDRAVVIPALGHTLTETYLNDADFHWKGCSVCGDNFDTAVHSFSAWTLNEEESKWHRSCTVCQREEERDYNEHELIHHERVEATCTENGSIEYWQCSVCGKYYNDDNAENEIAESDIVIPHHTLSAWDYNLDNHWKNCPVDGVVYKAEHTWGEWTEHTSGTVTHLFSECEICSARKVATKPEYLVYSIGIGEVKLKDLEDTPCGDFYVNGVKTESGSTINTTESEVTVEFRSYFGSNTGYTAYSFVVNNGSMRNLSGEKDADGNYSLKLELTNAKEYVLSLQLNTGGGSLSFDCYLNYKK